MVSLGNDIPDWDKTFIARWQAAIKREFGSGAIASHKLSTVGINPTTVKAWLNKGGRPTVANLCLVARAAHDPSSFMVEVFGDEPWARELGVALQRRRLSDAELAFAACQASGGDDPKEVILALSGPVRRYRYVTDKGLMTAPDRDPDEAAIHALGTEAGDIEKPVSEHVIHDRGWILIEDGEDGAPIIRCNAISVSHEACDVLLTTLENEALRSGAVLRVFITDWVNFPCATLYQITAELSRIREIRRHVGDSDVKADDGGSPSPATAGSSRLRLSDAPPSGAAFLRVWQETGGIVDADLIHKIEQMNLFELGGIFGVQDHQFRVGFVGPKLRLPVGLTRERITGLDLLEIQPSKGFGAMVASHFALAARERLPVVHLVRVTRQRSYRRVSFPIFDHRGRKVVAIIGFSDARNTETQA